MNWVKIEALVFIAVVKDMPKPDDLVASELCINICDFVETNKKIFLQCGAECALSMPVEESSEFVVVIPPPSRFIIDVLMNRKRS